MCSTSEDVRCESGTSSVQARIYSTSEDVQYESGTSSVAKAVIGHLTEHSLARFPKYWLN